MERALRGFLLLGFCACVSGCRGESRAPWLVLRRAEPSTLEVGTLLRVEGEGFAPGAPCALRLSGQSYRPLESSHKTRVSLPCRAVSDEEVQARVDAEALSELGDHGSFVGRAEVAFASPVADGEVTGSMAVRLDLEGPHEVASGSEQRLRERALRVLDLAGLSASDDESTASGVVVAAVRPGSPAAGLGLRAGDAIERASEVSVHALEDLAPPPSAASAALILRRPGQSARVTVTLPLAGLDAPELGAELSRLSALLAWLVLCIAWLSPVPSVLPWLVRNVQRHRATRAAAATLFGMPSRRRSALLRIGAPLCGSVLGLTVVRYAPPGVLAVRSLSLYLGFATLSLGSSFQTHPGSLRERMRAVAQKASRMLVTGVVLACACALFGARSFAALVDGQGGAPWRWALLQKPALVCAFPLYVVYAGRLATNLGSAPSRGFTARLHALEEVVSNVMLSALGAVIFWGGWQAPFAVTGESSKLLAAACFVAKVWAFGWLLACSRRLGWGERLRALPAAALCLLTLALTVAWIALAPPPEIELLIGQALAGSALVFALVTLVRTLPWLLPPPSAIRSAPVALRNGPSAPSEGSV